MSALPGLPDLVSVGSSKLDCAVGPEASQCGEVGFAGIDVTADDVSAAALDHGFTRGIPHGIAETILGAERVFKANELRRKSKRPEIWEVRPLA
jgi:hypothetical protein